MFPPFARRRKRSPFAPCAVPAAVTAGLQTMRRRKRDGNPHNTRGASGRERGGGQTDPRPRQAGSRRRATPKGTVPERSPPAAFSAANILVKPRAAFVAYRSRGGACVSPFRTGEEVLPFCPLCRPGSRGRRASDDERGESGTETHIPIPIGPAFIQIEAKQTRACGIVVIAAAQRQPQHNGTLPVNGRADSPRFAGSPSF